MTQETQTVLIFIGAIALLYGLMVLAGLYFRKVFEEEARKEIEELKKGCSFEGYYTQTPKR